MLEPDIWQLQNRRLSSISAYMGAPGPGGHSDQCQHDRRASSGLHMSGEHYRKKSYHLKSSNVNMLSTLPRKRPGDTDTDISHNTRHLSPQLQQPGLQASTLSRPYHEHNINTLQDNPYYQPRSSDISEYIITPRYCSMICKKYYTHPCKDG